ncbi:FkbM family methyltransferase [Rhodovulum iodosum]|uniref:FkbM family methyltransferase n=1 Tax=Rhodovulum iodosum TaxID=68291 RepID=UPI001473EA99|nr:FkbM family methyltransferase [Rhodovulum robiginosum]
MNRIAEPKKDCPDYDEVIECQGVTMPFIPHIVTPKIEKAMRNNRYEGGEAKTLRALVRPGDRVLELGAGMGLCASIAALSEGVEAVVAVEANPALMPVIRETLRLNGAERADLRFGAVDHASGPSCRFYLRHNFWASTMEPDSRPYHEVVEVPRLGLNDLLDEVRPTVLQCDIEGAELSLLSDPDVDLSGIRLLILELHPKVYGEEGVARLTGTLAARGFYRQTDTWNSSTVQVFAPQDGVRQPLEGSLMPTRRYRTWPLQEPRVMVATCMKDEGPFILEWLAWHRAVGVTDLVVFTNDCSDGSAELLDRLDDLGEVTHLPNPALAVEGDAHFQPRALRYTHYLRTLRDADFFISMDVDEFINIRDGEGRLTDLFAEVGPFDAISMSELNHGSNARRDFERGWVTEQFPAHQTPKPGKRKAKRGVKTIVRLSPRVARLRNHRPDFMPQIGPVLWLDGSGRYLSELQRDDEANGADARDAYDRVVLEHYPLRSLGSYLMKARRGDVVVANKSVSNRYWRTRNQHAFATSSFNPAQVARAKAEYARLMADERLAALHEAACDFHEASIEEIRRWPEMIERERWIFENAWREDVAGEQPADDDQPGTAGG